MRGRRNCCLCPVSGLGKKGKRKVIAVDEAEDGTHGPHPRGAYGPLGKMDIQTDYGTTV